MKNIIVALSLLMLMFSSAYAQDQRKRMTPEEVKEAHQKMEAARVAYLTNRLSLSVSQAEKFWPMYNKYNEEKYRIINTMYDGNRKRLDDMTDAEAAQRVKLRLDVQQQLLDLEKSYMTKFQTVLSAKQTYRLMTASRDFTGTVMRRGMNRDEDKK